MADNYNVVPMRSGRTKLGQATEAETKRVKDCRTRIARAEIDRGRHQARISDCYKFGMPWRHKFFATQPNTSQIDDIFDSTVMTVLEDFSADMLNTFTPMKARWCKSMPVKRLGAGDTKMVEAALQEYDAVVFGEMRRSNLYQALQECYLDLGPGTMAMSITDIGIAEPIHCEAIPQTELLLDRGMYGRVDGIWRKWLRMRGEEIGVKWRNAKAPDIPNSLEPGDVTEYEITDGVYRDWTTPAVEKWIYVVLNGDRILLEETYTGQGSNSLIVARWSRDSTTAWGIGPTYRVTPAIKVLNYLQEKELKAIDKAVEPVTSYEDDSVLNVDQGVQPGDWIPRAVGSKKPEVIESEADFKVSFAKREDLIHEIKRAHYQDRPEQDGKTPPSATQWADEAAERARRMGTPATNLVNEWQYAIIRRFAYLLNKRGVLPKVELNGDQIALEPVSPLLRAQEQEEVVRYDHFVEMIGARFGAQMVSVIIKAPEYATDIAEKMGVPTKLINTTAEIAMAIKQFAPVLGAAAGGGAPAPAAPAPPA